MGGDTEKEGESRKRPRTRGGGVGRDSGRPRSKFPMSGKAKISKRNCVKPNKDDDDSSSDSERTIADAPNPQQSLKQGNRKEDPKQKESAGKGKEKQREMDIGSEERVSKEPSDTGLATAVKVRHIFCKNQDKINEVYRKLHDDWLWFGEPIPPVLFGKVAEKYSECPSWEDGGKLDWITLRKATSLFEQVAFSTPVGITSTPFQSTEGYHIILCEQRSMLREKTSKTLTS